MEMIRLLLVEVYKISELGGWDHLRVERVGCFVSVDAFTT